ncbi:MAG: S8 family serine peptidase [Candidatus Delongbacteria bacterium]|nr:S8 family serine peptidase [Candidatus Delongbacteria bacterium]
MGRILFALLIACSILLAQETKIINGYTVTRGERPVINLSEVAHDAYETGRIWVKLAPEMETLMPDDRIYQSETKGLALKTGIKKIDQINEKYGIERIKPKQYGFYEISPASVKYKDRHKAWGFHLWMEVYLPEGTDVIAAVKDYMALDEVEFAEPVYKDILLSIDQPKVTVNDPQYSSQWHYNNTGQGGGTPGCDIDLPEAWDIERGNPEVLVAVQDMGIQYDHPDLDAHIWSGLGYDFQAMDSTIDPGHHGTHVAGTISAESNNGIGVAGIAGGSGAGDGVTLMSVQVYAADGSGGGNSNLPYEYSADNDAAISQNSWGYTSVGVYDQLVLDGIDYFNAYGGGTTLGGGLVIFAAGNSNATGSWYPGCYSGCMAVAATSNDDDRAYYSNYGTWVEIAAPGGDYNDGTTAQVLSTYLGSTYDWLQGTSMACPHVSGVAALVLSLAPGVFTNQEVRDILKNTTDNIDALNPSYIGLLGTGRLNAFNALNETLANLSNVERPVSITADAVAIDQIDLDWVRNTANDDVILVYTTDGIFGTPVNGVSYNIGNTIPVGGTVLYSGSGTSYSHTGLTDYTDYYYRAYSYDNSEEYSAPRSTSAKTLMAPMTPSAASMGFENSGSIPAGWTQEGNWTFVTTATRPTAPSEGSYFAYFNTASSTKKIVTPRFDLTDYTSVTINFDYLVSSRKVGPSTWYDKLRVYYKTSSTGTWVMLGTEYSGSYTAWQTSTLNISDAVRTNDFYFAFEAIEGSTIGYGVSVDDIIINGTPVGGSPPAVPSLITPANASLTSDLTPTFDWNDVSGATSYTIQIDDAAAFTSVNYTNSPTVSTYTPASNLPTGTWYWRVLATNANGSSAYTSGWSVTLGNPPAAPTLALPANASTLYILQPTFDWNDVSGATSYTILVDNNSNFGSPEINQSPAVSTYTPGTDMALGSYYWKVLSTNTFGSSAYSSTYTVTVAPLTAPINVVTSVAGSDLTVSWDAVAGATSYDIYSSIDPYGTYTFVTNIATNSYVVTASETKLFWYVVAKN